MIEIEEEEEVDPAKPFFIPPLNNFIIHPTVEELNSYTKAKLQSLPKLLIENEHASVEFKGNVDIVGVDFPNTVFLKKGGVVVYSEAQEKRGEKPKLLEKLNRPAVITIKNVEIPNDIEGKDYAKYWSSRIDGPVSSNYMTSDS